MHLVEVYSLKQFSNMLPVKKYNRMPSLLGDLFYDQWPEMVRRTTAPQINVIETDKKFVIEVAAPGMSKEDLKIELNGDNQLIVSLEKECEKEDKEKECCSEEDCTKDEKHHYLRREFSYTAFRQVFNLPDNIDREGIKAKMKHGVLHIRLPKRSELSKPAESKLIAIE